MQSKFAILTAFVSAAAAVVVCPLERTPNSCPALLFADQVSEFSGLSFVATFQNGARWDVLTTNVGNGHVGDVGWIGAAAPNVNEVFTAHTAGAPGRFTLTRKNAQPIDVTGNNNGASLLATTGRTAIWNIVCGDCSVVTGPNQSIGNNCGIQLVANGALTNLCANFQTDNVVRVLTCNNNNANQNIHIFSA
ncbi:hypothetical protein C8J57DRAFT_1636930 [Mycena rebaudengoi]|nr:hypothetical protein C8J57DRAFT_1619987 [Mycena rebaudengoi]KAJ7260774.1 hypothetical protein C8J57DRAFT_1636930 [Mycena rebaudengoi]